MAFGDWLSGLGQSAYSWAGDNPIEALSLGTGALGTGMGIWNQYQAGQQYKKAQQDALMRNQERQRLAEQFAQMGPGAFAPKLNAEQLRARYFRPAATFMAERGQTSGGSFQQALADAAVKAEMDRIQLGNSIYGNRLSALGYGQPAGPIGTLPASGSVGSFGQALQNLLLSRATRGGGQPQQQSMPGQTYGGTGMLGGDAYDRNYGAQPFDMSMPNMNIYGNFRAPAGPGDQRYSLTDFGPSSSMSDAISSWTAMPDYSTY